MYVHKTVGCTTGTNVQTAFFVERVKKEVPLSRVTWSSSGTNVSTKRNEALWLPSRGTCVQENREGWAVRKHYFIVPCSLRQLLLATRYDCVCVHPASHTLPRFSWYMYVYID